MEAIQTLFDRQSTSEQKKGAANAIVTNYNLPFDADDIIKTFNRLQNSPIFIGRAIALMHLSLTTNLRMFIAIIYSLLPEDNSRLITSYADFVGRTSSNLLGSNFYELGCNYVRNDKIVMHPWITLYDYYEFDISGLTLSNAIRDGLQEHIDSKVSYTKRAIK